MVALMQKCVSPSIPTLNPINPKHTDSLRVEVADMTLADARQKLETYGDIMSFTEITGPPGLECSALVVCVVYHDVRSAMQAMVAMDTLQCTPMEEQCNRTVHVSGDFQLDAESVQGVSNVFDDPGCQAAFFLEFFDWRNAMRVEEAVRRQAIGESECWTYPSSSCSDAVASLPDVAEEVTVRIKGLPNALCSKALLEVSLEQAGLEASVVSIRPQKGKPCGSADVTLSSREAAAVVLSHYSGCSWDRSGMVVSSTIVESATAGPTRGSMASKVSNKMSSKQRRHGESRSGGGGAATMMTASTCTPEPTSDCEVVELLA